MNIVKRFQNYHIWILLIVALSALAITYNFRIISYVGDAVLFYLLIPVLSLILLKEKLKKYGLALGDYRKGMLYAAILALLSVITSFLAVSYFPSIKAYYSRYIFNIPFIIGMIFYMTAWEFLFRGYLLKGMSKHFNIWIANGIQTGIFFIMHIGKPPLETFSTLFTGFLFGYVAIKSKSIWPMVVIHTVILVSVVYFANL